MQAPTRTSYDEVPYESKSFSETHPDRLATVATLFGMQPPNVERCRVLELGCADGVNLIPMAVSLPGSRFVGIDLSQRQVADGQATIAAIEVPNIELRAGSILDVGPDDGVFDYIICHGVYSWVPPEVREHILTLCSRNLASNGVAYVSYNTYPGWHVRRMVRDMLCYHARRVQDPREQVQQARALLEFLGQAVVNDSNSTYGSTVRGAAEVLRAKSDSYFLHEYLEEHNEPLYFHQFAERIQTHGLQYLGDAHISTMVMSKFAPEVQETLRRLAGNLVQMEQYLDFLQNRAFRRTLLCHAGIPLNHTLRPESLASLYVSSLAKPVAPRPSMMSNEPLELRTPDGNSLTTREPLLKAAMVSLAEVGPCALAFEALHRKAQERAGPAGPQALGSREADFLATRLLNYYVAGLVQLHAHAAPFALEASAHPHASPIVRHQAARSRRVTNLRHEIVEVSELARQLLLRLDGTQDRAQLLAALLELAQAGALRVEANGQPIQEPQQLREQLGTALDQTLTLLARSACLTS